MLCEICGNNEATFHYSEVVNGNKTEHHLCAECAAKTDISYYSSFFDNERLGHFLSGLLGNTHINNDEKDPKTHIICPSCKTSYGEFIRNSAFGCAECYNVFGPLLDDSIKKIQGSISHQGKKPKHLMEEVTDAGVSADEVKDAVIIDNEADLKDSDMSCEQLRKRIDIMSKQLKAAVAEEDFKEAARLRDAIKSVRNQLERMNEND